MKIGLKLLVTTLALSTSPLVTAQEVENQFIEFINLIGMTECDSFVSEKLRMEPDWYVQYREYSGNLHPSVVAATITTITGTYGDTIRLRQTFYQTPKKCRAEEWSTLTFHEPCQQVIQPSWIFASSIEGTDYSAYHTSANYDGNAYTKEINTPSGPICLVELETQDSINR